MPGSVLGEGFGLFVERCWFHVKGTCRLEVDFDGGVPGAARGFRQYEGRLQAPKTLGYQRAANHRVASDHLEKKSGRNKKSTPLVCRKNNPTSRHRRTTYLHHTIPVRRVRPNMPKAARVKKEAPQPAEEEDLVMEETPTSHQPGVEADDDASMADPDANEDFAGGNDEEEEEAQRVKIVSFRWSSIPT